MTLSIYRRLCLVLVVPLLVAGYVCARIAWPFDRYVNILCAPFLNSENCRPVGPPEGEFYKHVMKDAPAWFSVNPTSRDFKSYIYPIAEASARMEFGEILAAEAYAGHGPEVTAFMHNLVGKSAVFQLGVADKKRQSMVDIDPVFLYCHTLTFGSEPGTYTADCYGEGWGGPITFRADRASRIMLDSLNTSIEKKISDTRSEYRWFQIVMYPIFIYGFLILSLLWWLTVKAVRFVKRG
jgi:hypothetical protein